jgi:hypothetical protein
MFSRSREILCIGMDISWDLSPGHWDSGMILRHTVVGRHTMTAGALRTRVVQHNDLERTPHIYHVDNRSAPGPCSQH